MDVAGRGLFIGVDLNDRSLSLVSGFGVGEELEYSGVFVKTLVNQQRLQKMKFVVLQRDRPLKFKTLGLKLKFEFGLHDMDHTASAISILRDEFLHPLSNVVPASEFA